MLLCNYLLKSSVENLERRAVMAQKEISRQEALATLDRGDIIMVAIKVKRPIQIGMRPLDDYGHYSPIFLGSTEWVEEPNKFVIQTREELLTVVRALKGVDADYCDFFNFEFGNSGLVDIAVYKAAPSERLHGHRTIDIAVNPYNWRVPAGAEWTRIGPDYTMDGSI